MCGVLAGDVFGDFLFYRSYRSKSSTVFAALTEQFLFNGQSVNVHIGSKYREAPNLPFSDNGTGRLSNPAYFFAWLGNFRRSKHIAGIYRPNKYAKYRRPTRGDSGQA